jgi:RNA polymerase sigma-70 factor (ECF subfamily)
MASSAQVKGNTGSLAGSSRPAGDLDLAALVGRIAGGDRHAFGELFVSFGPVVKGMLVRQGVEVSLAEEIVQETMLTLWRKAGLYSIERGSAATWIFTIARNLRIDRVRREPAWQALTDEHGEEISDEMLPDDALAAKQLQSRMSQAISTLPPEQIEVVRLAYVEGLAHSDIALRLGVPLGTVKSRMRLAYQKIKGVFDEGKVRA